MLTKLTSLDKRILNRLQEDIPFIERPWEALAGGLNIREAVLLKKIAFLKKRGIIRRISAIFSPRKIHFVSTLVAVRASSGSAEKIAKKISYYPEVTHNYKRNAEYNIWFTLVAKNRKRITQIISRLKKDTDIERISEFPTVELFKINVKFQA